MVHKEIQRKKSKMSDHLTSTKGLTYCRPSLKGNHKKAKTSNKYCPVCQFKIRDQNHNAGDHHRAALRKKK